MRTMRLPALALCVALVMPSLVVLADEPDEVVGDSKLPQDLAEYFPPDVKLYFELHRVGDAIAGQPRLVESLHEPCPRWLARRPTVRQRSR